MRAARAGVTGRTQGSWFARCMRVCWAAPCTCIGLAGLAAVLLAGGRVRVVRGTLEGALRPSAHGLRPWARRAAFRAITFGHVILGFTAEELAAMRQHERVHVRQYERWGVFFFLAYPAASAWQLLRGRDAYWDNPFEVQARRQGGG